MATDLENLLKEIDDISGKYSSDYNKLVDRKDDLDKFQSNKLKELEEEIDANTREKIAKPVKELNQEIKNYMTNIENLEKERNQLEKEYQDAQKSVNEAQEKYDKLKKFQKEEIENGLTKLEGLQKFIEDDLGKQKERRFTPEKQYALALDIGYHVKDIQPRDKKAFGDELFSAGSNLVNKREELRDKQTKLNDKKSELDKEKKKLEEAEKNHKEKILEKVQLALLPLPATGGSEGEIGA